MLSQYTMPEMAKIFSQENRYQLMFDVSVTTCEALADIGQIPMEAFREIKAKASFSVTRIRELESETCNNSLAFIQCLSESIDSEAARFLHLGLCSADLYDMVTALQARQSADLLQVRLDQLRSALLTLAQEHKYTLMIGRTHDSYAEPITFGLKMALWIKELDRCSLRLTHARQGIAVGKINGAVGSYASIDPRVEIYVCRRFGLHTAEVTNQIIQRDRLAEFLTTLALIGSSIEKFAVEIRKLQSSDVREVEERMVEGGIGSTSLPHKQRPYRSEIVSGLSRVLRGNALSAMEDIPIWHEQDSSHTGVESIIFPDSCQLLDYMIFQFTSIMQHLKIYPDTMRVNLEKSLGLVFSQRVMLALVEKGLNREKAYELVMDRAITAWHEQGDFQFLVLENREIGRYLSRQEIMDLFDYNYFLSHVDYIFDRAGL